MATINQIYINALLADATYALEDERYKDYTGNDLFQLLTTRMTPELAKYISENLTVVTHIERKHNYG
ncbi:MAG: hypothetical protein IPK77_02105 [Cellvibrio sp.]|nr:hypothetical protein [Cellvibrio sp.]